MECNTMQETGLLYLSHELGEVQTAEFLDHLSVCSVCRDELAAYEHEKKALYSLEMLGENPSAQTDAKLLAACSRRPMITGFNLFSGVWGKRTVYSLLFLFFGLGAGLYFAMNYTNVLKPNNVALTSEQHSAPLASAVQEKVPAMLHESLNSQGKDMAAPAESPLAIEPALITPVQDIIPVALTKE